MCFYPAVLQQEPEGDLTNKVEESDDDDVNVSGFPSEGCYKHLEDDFAQHPDPRSRLQGGNGSGSAAHRRVELIGGPDVHVVDELEFSDAEHLTSHVNHVRAAPSPTPVSRLC